MQTFSVCPKAIVFFASLLISLVQQMFEKVFWDLRAHMPLQLYMHKKAHLGEDIQLTLYKTFMPIQSTIATFSDASKDSLLVGVNVDKSEVTPSALSQPDTVINFSCYWPS